MDVLHLIDRLEELVAEARRMPIGQGVVIDRRRLLELVDQMRSSVPWEVKEAMEVVASKEAVLEEARREGEGIIHRAELEAAARLEETALVRAAEAQAQSIIAGAEERAQALLDQAQHQGRAKLTQAEQLATNQMDEADRYALEMFRRLEQQLDAFAGTVRAAIAALEEKAPVSVREDEP
jgi:flagellar biosynthesis/type III secretory pathway protein FliH